MGIICNMVSIIIPFNNGEKYLGKCLENLKKIEYDDFEIILVNDELKNRFNYKEILKKYENQLNIKYFQTSEETIGVGNARNLGIQKSSGKYIMFVDIDDTIDVNILRDLEEYIEENIEMIKYKMKIIKENKEFLTGGKVFGIVDGEEGFNKLCFNDKYLDSPCLYLIKKDLLERTKLRFQKNVYHEDFGLIPRLLVNAKTMISLNYYGYNYFQTQNSIMRDNNYSKERKKVKDKFTHYEILKKNIANFDIKKETKENLLIYYTNSILSAIEKLKKEDRVLFEEKIKEKRMLNNIKAKNVKQFVKKLILKIDIEVYFKLKHRIK